MMLSPDNITKDQFAEALHRYSTLIESRSSVKTPTKLDESKLSLTELDEIRFSVIPSRYYKQAELDDINASPTPLSRDDFLQLVTWKLKHGTFRPNLMNLAKSNTDEEVVAITKAAFESYKEDGFKVTNAIKKLTELKGVGPATASLLLAVHDPTRIVFFGDEVFSWMCHDGKKGNIRYSTKEYEELVTETRKLISRLEVDARAIEMVGYVLIKEAGPQPKEGPQETIVKKERAKAPRVMKTPEPKKPTEMTVERKNFLVALAEKGRAGRIAKKAAKKAKGEAFRARVDAARKVKGEEDEANGEPTEPDSPLQPAPGTKRKADSQPPNGKRGRRSVA